MPRKSQPKKNEQQTSNGGGQPDDLLIVGIGASAGGIEALGRFFKNLPDGDSVTFVVVMHLSPEHKSQLAEVLQAHTHLPVHQVTEHTRYLAGNVYVIPPGRLLAIDDGHLQLSKAPGEAKIRMPIDHFFDSLSVKADRAVAVVLSGGGADGSIGLKNVKERGGLVIAQSPDDAEHPSMPQSAIATGLVDFILPADELAVQLISYWAARATMRLPDADETPSKADGNALDCIFAQLHARTGDDFSRYKRSTVLRRVGRRLQLNGLADLAAYSAYLRLHPEETAELMRNLLISVTHFFRDAEAWQALAENQIPSLFEGKNSGDQLRVWVAGCASGEEAYTIAILLAEHAAGLEAPPEIQSFATDLDESALVKARAGTYPESSTEKIPERYLRTWFIRDGERFRIKKEIRELVLFAAHSMLRDPPFSRLDLITCRNLLIYLNRNLQDDVLRLFHYGLRPQGLLFLGNAESIDADGGKLFHAVDPKHRLFRREKFSVHRDGLPLPALNSAAAGYSPGHQRRHEQALAAEDGRCWWRRKRGGTHAPQTLRPGVRSVRTYR